MSASVRVWAASATSSSLFSSRPRRFSYQAIAPLTPRVSTSTASCASVTATGWAPCSSSFTAPRISSKQVIERNPTMARAPSVSNLLWPYGWSSSGSFAATRTTIRARRLFRTSTDESRALPRMARDPERRPTNDLAATIARLAIRRPMKTRRTRAVAGRPSGRESGMGCKLVSEACLVNGSEQSALEIPGLRDVEELRVIPAGAGEREQLEPPAGVVRGIHQHVPEHRPADVVGARAGEQHATGCEQTHGAKIDLLVTGERAGDALLRLRERRRVEDDRVEALVPPFQLAQQIEHVRLLPGDVGEAVERRVLRSPGQRLPARIDRGHRRGAARQVQRERAVIGEQVERRAGPGVRGDEAAVLTLVEECPRLLTRMRRGEVAHTVLLDLHRFGHAAECRHHLERQPLVPPDRDVVAEQNAGGGERGSDPRDDVVPSLLDPRRQQLRDDVRAVPIHHQGRQAVCFGVHHTVRRGREPGAPAGGGGDALAPPRRVDRLAAAREQPQANLGPR